MDVTETQSFNFFKLVFQIKSLSLYLYLVQIHLVAYDNLQDHVQNEMSAHLVTDRLISKVTSVATDDLFDGYNISRFCS